MWHKIFVSKMNSDQLLIANSSIDGYFAESTSVPVKLQMSDKIGDVPVVCRASYLPNFCSSPHDSNQKFYN